jgi:hypothetical protein
MDGDPGVEPELDAFSLILPLPYRVAIILVAGEPSCADAVALKKLLTSAGVWAWGLNLQYLDFVRIVRRLHSDGCAALTFVLGCSCAYKIPFSPDFTPCLSPRLNLPLCRFPHRTPALLIVTLLDDNAWFFSCCGILGVPTGALPTFPGALLCTTLSTTVTQRKISLPVHTKASQHRGLG